MRLADQETLRREFPLSSEGLTQILELVMQHQNLFAFLQSLGRSGLLQIVVPTDTSLMMTQMGWWVWPLRSKTSAVRWSKENIAAISVVVLTFEQCDPFNFAMKGTKRPSHSTNVFSLISTRTVNTLPALQERAPGYLFCWLRTHGKFVVQFCTVFFGLEDEAFGILEDQENS
jgi:hypothetical protein